jgi:hypothetical protein
MDIPTLSLIVAALAVFVGPIISWAIARRQLRASAQLAVAQIEAAMLTSHQQTIAPMRQAWINSLRDLLAELVSSALHYYVSGYEDRTDAEYRHVTLLEAKVQLMLNTNEEDHRKLENMIRRMVAAIQYRKGEPDKFPDLHTEVLALSRTILKREWDRVKQPPRIPEVPDSSPLT